MLTTQLHLVPGCERLDATLHVHRRVMEWSVRTKPASSTWSIPFRFPDWTLVRISRNSDTWYMTHVSHLFNSQTLLIFGEGWKSCCSSVRKFSDHQHTLNIGTELVPEKSQNFYIPTRLSARDDFIEFCRRESLKTPVTSSSLCAIILFTVLFSVNGALEAKSSKWRQRVASL